MAGLHKIFYTLNIYKGKGEFMSNDTMLVARIIFLIVINIPVFLIVGRVFFDSWEGFFKALWFCAKPDFMSLFDGTYWEDHWNELKFSLFLIVCGIIVYGEYYVIVTYIAT